MTQVELVALLASKMGLPKSKAEEAFKSLCEIIKDDLKKDGTVKLPGIGTLKIQQRAARTGRNPRTGKTLQIPARKTAKFQISKPFADELNG